MTHAKHCKASQGILRAFGVTFAAALGAVAFLIGCAAVMPSQAQGEQQWKPTDWHPMAVEYLSYACDPVLGVIVKQPQFADGSGSVAISVTSYAQMTAEQRARMCDGR